MLNEIAKSLILQAMGETSMAWSKTPKGIFESKKAKEISEKLFRELEKVL